jgi:hypothetical protein
MSVSLSNEKKMEGPSLRTQYIETILTSERETYDWTPLLTTICIKETPTTTWPHNFREHDA